MDKDVKELTNLDFFFGTKRTRAIVQRGGEVLGPVVLGQARVPAHRVRTITVSEVINTWSPSANDNQLNHATNMEMTTTACDMCIMP